MWYAAGAALGLRVRLWNQPPKLPARLVLLGRILVSARRTVSSIAAGAALTATLGMGAYFLAQRQDALPTSNSTEYQQVVRAFYRGLAALDAGLLDAAKTDFTSVTELAPGEPAAWANLGLAHLRLSEFDAAARAIGEAAAHSPRTGDVAMLQGTLESAQGNNGPAIEHFRRAVVEAPANLRARYALAGALERARGDTAERQVQQLHDEMLAMQPGNLVVLVDRARLAARMADAPSLDDSVRRLVEHSSAWPAAATEQLDALRAGAVARDYQAIGRTVAFLRNVLARVPTFRESLAAVTIPAGLLAAPIDRFLALAPVSSVPSPPDLSLAYSREPLANRSPTPTTTMVAWPLTEEGPVGVFAVAAGALRRLDAPERSWPFPTRADVPPESGAILPLDWNHDFRTDLLLAGSGGLRLLLQTSTGTFAESTRSGSFDASTAIPSSGAWAADIDMDGDLDAVVGRAEGDPLLLRNNGDGSWRALPIFQGVEALRAFSWGDVDRDGDPDAVLLDATGGLHVFVNQQSGAFERRQPPSTTEPIIALTLGDANADGALDIVTLDTDGVVRQTFVTGNGWDERQLAVWPGGLLRQDSRSYRLNLVDLDNNGGLDLVAAGAAGTVIWLTDQRNGFQPLTTLADTEVFSVLDVDADGRLDFVGISEGQPVRMIGRGQQDYHWQVIRTRAQTNAGDQRINSFAVGGEIEVRSGLLVQKHLLSGVPVHVGLGTRTEIDVARIVWPNGVMQAEFDLRIDSAVVAEQRLKGSCPWLFAHDGHGMTFVTDVLWRSPLGLRINAQDTAGTTQTEDWVKIRGDQLAARDGAYDLRITAELWETHFFDHVALTTVDHPAGVEIFVDERFARDPPSLVVRAMTDIRALDSARDDAGLDVTDLVHMRDGRHVAGFAKGNYQGLAREHTLEFELSEPHAGAADLWLVAHGWVYPTDSSINVAIAQGANEAPHGLVLEARNADGEWRVVDSDLGFPAGKNKTLLIDLSARPRGVRRLRLRTNMEIYWDWMASARASTNAQLRTTRLTPAKADLQYRGFSRTRENRAAHAPELPDYSELVNTVPRWRDLEGYHTRFGDVKELLGGIDDRYVIMNAGDELRLEFPSQTPPAPGWVRDFIFISDGWEKDGDFNTAYSKTVLPLPSHDQTRYVAVSPSLVLEDDPVYRRYPEDWQRYHTRFVAPDTYLRGLTLR